MEYDHDHHSPSFRRRIKTSISVSRWFNSHSESASSASSSAGSDDESCDQPAQISRSPPSWIRSMAHDLPEKCTSLLSKIGAGAGRTRRRASGTSEFRYDPMSYALNFEDESARLDEFPNFSARLQSAAVSRGIAAWS